MNRILKVYRGMGTKEFSICKVRKQYRVDVVAYGEWSNFFYFNTVKELFEFIRSWL